MTKLRRVLDRWRQLDVTVRDLPVGDGGFLLFPITNSPAVASSMERVVATIAPRARSAPTVAYEICLPVPLTPRTAAVHGHAQAVLADEAYDYTCTGGAMTPNMPVDRSRSESVVVAAFWRAVRRVSDPWCPVKMTQPGFNL